MPALEFWNTLVSHDLERSRAFYSALGFAVADAPAPGCITVRPCEGALLCLFEPGAFAAMLPGEVCDSARAQELVQSVSVTTRAELDALLDAARATGGTVRGAAQEQPFGWAGGFQDPDGHAWAVLVFESAGA